MNFRLDITSETDLTLGAAIAAITVFDDLPADREDVLDPLAWTSVLEGPKNRGWGDGSFTLTFDASGIGGSGGVHVAAEHRVSGLFVELTHLGLRGVIPWQQIRTATRAFLDTFAQIAVMPEWADTPCIQSGTFWGDPFHREDADALRRALEALPAGRGGEVP